MKSPLFCSVVILVLQNIINIGIKSVQTANCGHIFTDKQFVLTSENYPQPYPPGKECFYLLKAGNCTSNFNIEFLDFNLASSVGCTKDRLEIGSQDALCGMKNGSKVYISEKGSLKLKFVSDNEAEKTNRGFRLLVTRTDECEGDNSTIDDNFTESRNIEEETTEPVLFEWTPKTTTSRPNPSYLPPALQACCQNNIFSSKTFLLVSPNFPYSVNTPSECTYIIKRTNSLVCRLRINLLFFSLGPPTQNSCPYGHLEIDGKYICGCNSDIQLTTDFRDSETKALRFNSAGYRVDGASGFVLEVIQDECQKRYSPENGIGAEKSSEKFRFYNDQFNRIQWPQHNNIEQLKLIKERSYNLPQKSNENVYKHFYFFAPDDEEDTSWAQNSQDTEETNYIDISSINVLLTNYYSYQQCMQWNRNQYILLEKRFGNSLKLMCTSSQQTVTDQSNCIVLSALSGSVSSPGYPMGYLANKNECYRFKISPGYCAVNMYFKDFQLQSSYDCLKDYLAINQYRYCGSYLTNKQVTINTNGKSTQDLKFISDAIYCGKGFSALYQQVRCQQPDDNSITPINCNPEGKNADENPISCEKVISEKYFIIRNEPVADLCTYDITRISEDVCKVRLYFDNFNLPCEVGSITVNGRAFCGQRSGQSITLEFEGSITIIYQRNKIYSFMPNIGFLIRGEQIDKECDTFTPEPVRLVATVSNKDILDKNSIMSYPGRPDVCELIKNNISSQDLPHKICELITKYNNATECYFSRAIVVDDPQETNNLTKIRLYNKDSEENGYKEIECENNSN